MGSLWRQIDNTDIKLYFLFVWASLLICMCFRDGVFLSECERQTEDKMTVEHKQREWKRGLVCWLLMVVVDDTAHDFYPLAWWFQSLQSLMNAGKVGKWSVMKCVHLFGWQSNKKCRVVKKWNRWYPTMHRDRDLLIFTWWLDFQIGIGTSFASFTLLC